MKIWTEEKLEQIKKCLEAGQTNAQIATQFGVNTNIIEKTIYRYRLSKHRKQKIVVYKEKEVEDFIELNDVNFEEIKQQAKIQWKLIPNKINKNPKSLFKTYLIVADIHIPEENKPAVKAVIKLMDDIKFDGLINLGDYQDLSCISHWNKNKRKTLEMKRLKTDYIQGNALLDEFDKRLPKNCDKRFFKGNHEQWIDDMIEENPVLDGLFDVESALYLADRGYKIYPYNHIERIGRLHFTHGIYATTNTVKKHLDETKVNIMIGHGHSPEMKLASSPAREIALVGYEVGCLTDLDPDYNRHRPNSHSHGFAIVYFYDSGYFEVDNKRILNGKFIHNNKIYDGNEKN